MSVEIAEEGAHTDETVTKPDTPETETGDPSKPENQAADGGSDDGADGQESDEQKAQKTRMQKRFDQLTWEKNEALRESARLKAQLEANKNPQTPSGPAPKPENFDHDPEKYAEAYADWKIGQQQEQQRAQQESASKADASAEQAVRVATLLDTGRSQFENFDEVIGNPALAISEAMLEVITTSDKGAELAYFLGSNPDKAREIAQLSGPQVAYAMGRLESSLGATPEKPVSKAPPPPPKVGAKSATKKDPSQMSTEEWMAWRSSQLRKS